ncbi:MAG: hypothetical protein NVS2B12_00820 [Ktedonobacteraceae bacterium]
MLAEELVVPEANSALWNAVQPLLNAALRLEQHDTRYSWHGWKKEYIDAFLHSLPEHCTLLAAVWETEERPATGGQEHERLLFGCACEVHDGKICAIYTFDALTATDLPPIEQLEPGYPHALELMRATKVQVAPVAWALFTDETTWNEWLFAEESEGALCDKGELLASLARQGRCVLMGSQTAQHHI